MRSHFSKLLSSISALSLGSILITGSAFAQGNELITKDDFYGEAFQQDSFDPTISADGTVTAFVSYASDMVPGGIGAFAYIYIHDRSTGTIERIDHVNLDSEFNYAEVKSPFISANGQYVVFRATDSSAPGFQDWVYLYDRLNGTLERTANIIMNNNHDPLFNKVSISDDGNKIAYITDDRPNDSSDTNGVEDIFVFDRSTQTDSKVTMAFDGQETDAKSFDAMISGDGNTVLFYSEASNLMEFGSGSGLYTVSLAGGAASPIAQDEYDADGNYRIVYDGYISSDGRWIAYGGELRSPFDNQTFASAVYVFDQTSGSEEKIAEHYETQFTSLSSVSISDDGNWAFYGAMERSTQLENFPEARLYLLDRTSNNNRLISSRAAYWKGSYNIGYVTFGQQISRDGSTIAFPTAILAPGVEPVSAFNLYTGEAMPGSQSPIANAGPDVLYFGAPVQLDGTRSSDDVTAMIDLNYEWEYVTDIGPEEPTGDIIDPNGPTPSVDRVNILMRLTVSDEDGLFSGSDYVLIEPGNTPPSANAGPGQSIYLGDTAALTGSGFDPDGDALTYSWSLVSKPSGSTASLSGTSETASFVPDLAGTYYAQFQVFDGFEYASDLARITVTDPLVYAGDQVSAARSIVAGLSRSDFDNRKRQNELLGALDNILTSLQQGDNVSAISGIDALLPKLDGCAVNGSPDTKGKQKDWITTCSAQTQVQNLLLDAKSVL